MIIGAKEFQNFVLAFFVETTMTVIALIYINPLIERLEGVVYKLLQFLSKKSSFFEKMFRKILIKQLM